MYLKYINKDGGLRVVMARAKNKIEKDLGALTDEQYRQHVLDMSIPVGSSEIEEISPEEFAVLAKEMLGGIS